LLSHFGNEEKIYNCDDSDLVSINWLSESQKYKLLDKNLTHAYEIIEWCDDNRVSVISYADELYPDSLRKIDDFPAVLYCYGNMPDFNDSLSIGIVGTRKMSTRGEKNAFTLGYQLSKGGAVTVSGMALGIDCTAQMGTLSASGITVAVLGSGIDVIYPKANASLYYEIAKSVAVLTEYPPSTPPNGRNFPIRNRIISGLCNGIVVVEGDENSGSMITARRAKKQGRDIFAVPGPAKEYLSAGPNALLKDGAIVAEDALDILEQYLDKYRDIIDLSAAKEKARARKFNTDSDSNIIRGLFRKRESSIKTPDKNTFKEFESRYERAESAENSVNIKEKLAELPEDQLKIYNFMPENEAVSAEYFLELGIRIGDIIGLLTMLEVAHLISSEPGGLYLKRI
jgi:DNA processing protein